MKKAILTFLFSMGLLLNLAFECCPDLCYWNLESFEIQVYNYKNGKRTNNTTQIVSDTLALRLSLSAHFLAGSMPSNPLISSCQATSCDPYGGEKGMKDEISKVLISGNTYVFGQRFVQSLSGIALIDGYLISTWLVGKKYHQLFADNHYHESRPLQILLTKRPEGQPIHDISIAFVMKSGAVIQAITPKIEWGPDTPVLIHHDKEGN